MEFLTIFAEHFVPILATVLGTVLTVLLSGLVKKFGSKLDVETKERLDSLIGGITHQGVAYAEQWAKNLKKSGTEVASNQKLYKAMEYIAAEIRKYKLDQLAEEELVKKIESVLGFHNMGTELLPLEGPGIITDEEGEENDENWR